jgi:hypothetical protein
MNSISDKIDNDTKIYKVIMKKYRYITICNVVGNNIQNSIIDFRNSFEFKAYLR